MSIKKQDNDPIVFLGLDEASRKMVEKRQNNLMLVITPKNMFLENFSAQLFIKLMRIVLISFLI